jgi:hypothetical protein
MSRFATAKANAGDAPKTKKKSTAEEVSVAGLEDLAIVNAVIKQLETLQSTLKEDVNGQMLDHFTTNGMADKKKPANFAGVDGAGTGSMQLRKRTSRSKLTPADIEILDEVGISYTESDDSLFYINKKYAEDEKLLEKVSKALDKVPGIPTDFIEATPTTYVTTDESIDELFKNGKLKRPRVREVLQIVGTLATRLKYTGDHDELMDKLSEMID